MSETIKNAMEKAGIKSSNDNGGNTKKKKKKKAANVKQKPAISSAMHGQIKWFDIHKGIGFVRGDDGKDYFVHFNKIATGRTYLGFDTGDPVTFRVNVDDRSNRLQAVNVSLDMDMIESGKTPNANQSLKDTAEDETSLAE